MPPRKIIHLPHAPHFVTFSTHQRRRFLSPERARDIIVEVLQGCLERHRASCHGFVIMPNHVHALLTVDTTSTLSKFILAWKKTGSHRLKQFYAEKMTNYQTQCPPDCPIWQARFYDFNVASPAKLHEKLDYMHHNPVKAGLVAREVDWVWSSARFYGQNEDVDVTITPW
jgi:putative transposase